jgi:hypothetical protein
VGNSVIIGNYVGSVYHLNAENRSIKHLHLQSYALLLKKIEDLFNSHPNLKPYENSFHAFTGYIVFGVAFACIKAGQISEAKGWLKDKRLNAYPQKNSIMLLQMMQYFPNGLNQVILQILRSIGKVNV